MYLRIVTIENIRSLKSFHLQFAPEECPGWHVLVGDNGSGKSTLVRAIAVALAGPSEAGHTGVARSSFDSCFLSPQRQAALHTRQRC